MATLTTAIPTSFVLASSPKKRHSTTSSRRAFTTINTPSINPFAHLAPVVSKDEIRAFRRPDSDTWMDLVHIMWTEQQLHDLPQDDVRREALLAELKRERISLRRKSCSPFAFVFNQDSEKEGAVASSQCDHQQQQHSSRVLDAGQRRSDRTDLTALPSEVRCMIYAIVLTDLAYRERLSHEGRAEDASLSDDVLARSGLLVLSSVFPSLEREIASTAANLSSNSSLQFAFDETSVEPQSSQTEAVECLNEQYAQQDQSHISIEDRDGELSCDYNDNDMIGTASSTQIEAISPRILVPIITIPNEVNSNDESFKHVPVVDEIFTPTESLGFSSARGLSEDGDGDDGRSSCYSSDDCEDSGMIDSICNDVNTDSIDESHSSVKSDSIDNTDDNLKKHSVESDRDSGIVKSWQLPEMCTPEAQPDKKPLTLELPTQREDTTEASPASPEWSAPSPSSRRSKRLSTISTMTTSSSYMNGEKPRKFVRAVKSLWRIGRRGDEVDAVRE